MKITIEAEGDDAIDVLRRLSNPHGSCVYENDNTSVVSSDPVSEAPVSADTTAKEKKAAKAKAAKEKRDAKKNADAAIASAAAVVKEVAEVVASGSASTTTPPNTLADVKVAVMAAIKRLEVDGEEKPKITVVKFLVDLTGKKRVSEIEEGDYDKVITALEELGSSF